MKRGPKPKILPHDIINLYTSGKDCYEIGRLFKLDPKTIWYHLNKSGIKCRPRGTVQNKTVNTEYFNPKNITHESAYWLGFIMGDGSIQVNKLTIALAKRDEEHLKIFNKVVGLSTKLYYRETKSTSFNKTGTICHGVWTVLYGKKMLKYMDDYNIKINKTKYGGIPKIPEEYQNSFILGLLDSDGWISYDAKNRYTVGWCGHQDTISFIQKCLEYHLDIKLNIRNHHKNSSIKNITTSKKENLTKITNWLLKDVNYSLERKRTKLQHIIRGFQNVQRLESEETIISH